MEESLKLDNQICFPLYVCSKEIIRRYKPFLDKLNLTYTQYLVMMVLWEQDEINVSLLGEKLFLDSGTLTPLLKKMEVNGLVVRTRALHDERNIILQLTEQGRKLEKQAKDIPSNLAKCLNVGEEDFKVLYDLLYKLINQMEER